MQYVEPVFDRRTQGVPFHTGYQDRQLSTWMENIIGMQIVGIYLISQHWELGHIH